MRSGTQVDKGLVFFTGIPRNVGQPTESFSVARYSGSITN